MNTKNKGTMTITFGERVENHKGMQMIGNLREKGLSVHTLLKTQEYLNNKYPKADVIYINISDYAPKNIIVEDAGILIIKNGVKLFGQNTEEMMKENLEYEWDKKAKMYGQIRNKTARWNVCFADIDQEPSYEEGKGTVINFNKVDIVSYFRDLWRNIIDDDNVINLNAEGNWYYDSNKCYIGFHGDTERKIVIAIRLGESMPLVYQWFLERKPIGERLELLLEDGDIYIMSEKAVGTDWKKVKTPTLRHAAGSKKHTTYVEKKSTK